MWAEFIHEFSKWENIEGSPSQTKADTPDHQWDFNPMMKAKDGQTQVCKYTSFYK